MPVESSSYYHRAIQIVKNVWGVGASKSLRASSWIIALGLFAGMSYFESSRRKNLPTFSSEDIGEWNKKVIRENKQSLVK